jgi:hypothetical protein
LGEVKQKAPGEDGHYSRFTPEPIEVAEAWGLNHHQASALAYLVRYDAKGGVQDLEKAIWYIQRLIALETKKESWRVDGGDFDHPPLASYEVHEELNPAL